MLSLKQRASDIKEEHNVVKMEVIQNKKNKTKTTIVLNKSWSTVSTFWKQHFFFAGHHIIYN